MNLRLSRKAVANRRITDQRPYMPDVTPQLAQQLAEVDRKDPQLALTLAEMRADIVRYAILNGQRLDRLYRMLRVGFAAVVAFFLLLAAIEGGLGAIAAIKANNLAHHADRLSRDVSEVERAQQVALAKLNAATIAGCQRQNLSTVKQNASSFADWKVFRVVIAETRAAAPDARREMDAFLTPLRVSVAAKTWTPTLNCAIAVMRHGAHYVLPQPVPFNRALPPRGALKESS